MEIDREEPSKKRNAPEEEILCAFCKNTALFTEDHSGFSVFDTKGTEVILEPKSFCGGVCQQRYYKFNDKRVGESTWAHVRRNFFMREFEKTIHVMFRYHYSIRHIIGLGESDTTILLPELERIVFINLFEMDILRYYNRTSRLSSGGKHSILVGGNDMLYMRGYNGDGQLGFGADIHSFFQWRPMHIPNVVAVSCGNLHTLILQRDDSGKTHVSVSGNNEKGQLGIGDTTGFPRNRFVELYNLNVNVISIATGGDFSVLLVDDGTLLTCGNNNHGQLGRGDTSMIESPLFESGMDHTDKPVSGVIGVSCGDGHTMIVKADGTLWGCGANHYNQKTPAKFVFGKHNRFVQVELDANGDKLNDVISVHCGSNHTLIIRRDGSVWGTGFHMEGQLGTNRPLLGKEHIIAFEKVSGIEKRAVGATCSKKASIVIDEEGGVWATGTNGHSQLGFNNRFTMAIFRKVPNGEDVVEVSMEESLISFLLKKDDSLWIAGKDHGTFQRTEYLVPLEKHTQTDTKRPRQ